MSSSSSSWSLTIYTTRWLWLYTYGAEPRRHKSLLYNRSHLFNFSRGYNIMPTVSEHVHVCLGDRLKFLFRENCREYSVLPSSTANKSCWCDLMQLRHFSSSTYYMDLHCRSSFACHAGNDLSRHADHDQWGGCYWMRSWTWPRRNFCGAAPASENSNYRLHRFILVIVLFTLRQSYVTSG